MDGVAEDILLSEADEFLICPLSGGGFPVLSVRCEDILRGRAFRQQQQ